jgi:hypothetical protein
VLHEYGADLNHRPPMWGQPLSPLELACCVRDDTPGVLYPIHLPGDARHQVDPVYGWEEEATFKWPTGSQPINPLATGQLQSRRLRQARQTDDNDSDHDEHEDSKDDDERKKKKGSSKRRRWNLDIIKWLLANGARDDGWIAQETRFGCFGDFRVNPLYLSTCGNQLHQHFLSHHSLFRTDRLLVCPSVCLCWVVACVVGPLQPLRVDLVRFWLERYRPTFAAGLQPPDWKSLPCDVVERIGTTVCLSPSLSISQLPF